jgi:hypothetical protein
MILYVEKSTELKTGEKYPVDQPAIKKVDIHTDAHLLVIDMPYLSFSVRVRAA